MVHREFAEENYLEAIYILYKSHREVRSIDIANYLEVARSTVHQMLRKLVDKGYILYEEDKIVRFTEEGEKIAKGIYERHLYLTKLLIEIGIEQKRAEEEACQIEHIISEDSFQKIKKYFGNKI
ncbi:MULTISPECIES: metal-dependent transcriptional regulator [Bacillota]|uniref:metal-dependent transcriptional regulator n=1 Tax=Bacillota TaxID=1239 RepID=UPI0009B0864D|nr:MULTISPECIES: metal-dependent transcriptional regulator [Bacillota]MDU2557839.1 metal-dependent transcriptional regulator [Anaerococcus prevotii]MDU2583730.1 metal-dependent transcriptional regulator [Anaerococcus prevotii]